jgi:hypothetical protein
MKKIYKLKTRLFYHEPTTTHKIRQQYDEYVRVYSTAPKEIYLPAEVFKEYFNELGEVTTVASLLFSRTKNRKDCLFFRGIPVKPLL